MATTLQDKILRRDAQGRLVEQTLPQLAKQANLAAPPITPGGAQAIGASPNVAKMAGTPSQKQSAIRQATDAVNTLQQELANKQYRTQMTSEEQSKAQSGQRLQELLAGNSERVQKLVGTKIAELGKAGSVAPSVAGVVTAAPGMNNQEKIDAAFQATLTTIQKDPTSQAAREAYNNLVSLIPENQRAAIGEQLAGALTKQMGTLGGLAAGGIADTINVSSILPELNVTKEELSSLLGVQPGVLDTMSLADLSKTIQRLGTATEKQIARQSDTLLGQAERAGMRELGKELSTSGVSAFDASMISLADQIARSETVQFAGRSWNVEDLLNDTNISKLISDYITAPKSKESLALINDPQARPLIEFIEKNRTALTGAAEKFQATGRDLAQINEFNKNISRFGNVTLSEDIMRALYPTTWGTSSASKLEPVGLIAALQGLPSGEQQAAANAINLAIDTHPDLPIGITTLNPSTLHTLVTKVNGISPLDTLVQTYTNKKMIENTGDIDTVINILFGGAIANVEQAQALLDEDKRIQKVRGTPPAYPFLDANKDNKVDNLDSLKQYALSRLNPADTLEEVLAGNKQQGTSKTNNPLTPAETEIYTMISQLGLKSVRELAKTNSLPILKKMQAAGLTTRADENKIIELEKLEKLIEEEKRYTGAGTLFGNTPIPLGAVLFGKSDEDRQTDRQIQIKQLKDKYNIK